MSHFQGLLIPEEPPGVQQANKTRWNAHRSRADADFFTVGYAGRTIDQLMTLLLDAGVSTIVDVRQHAVSLHRPEFSKMRLSQSMADKGLQYLHRPDLGVPRDIRARAIGQLDRTAIWEWYDANVVGSFLGTNLDEFFNCVVHPVAFMCVERDPYACHRHRMAIALERHGLKGYDL